MPEVIKNLGRKPDPNSPMEWKPYVGEEIIALLAHDVGQGDYFKDAES